MYIGICERVRLPQEEVTSGAAPGGDNIFQTFLFIPNPQVWRKIPDNFVESVYNGLGNHVF